MKRFSMYCTRCRKITNIELDNPILESCDSLAQLCNDKNNSIIKLGIVTNCDHCDNQSVNIVIDEPLANLISMLNISGYITDGCCSGHEEEDMMYISFLHYHDNEFYEEIFNGWEIQSTTMVSLSYSSLEERDTAIKTAYLAIMSKFFKDEYDRK